MKRLHILHDDSDGLDVVLCSWQESAILFNLDFLVGIMIRVWRRDKKHIQLSGGKIGILNDETCFYVYVQRRKIEKMEILILNHMPISKEQNKRVKHVKDEKMVKYEF